MADVTFTPSEIAKMPDHELATYLSGGFGPGKRAAMIAAVKAMADICAGKWEREAPKPPNSAA